MLEVYMAWTMTELICRKSEHSYTDIIRRPRALRLTYASTHNSSSAYLSLLFCTGTAMHSVPPISGADSMGHGGTVSKRTANKKLTKLCWPSCTKALTKATNCDFRAKKVEGHDWKKFCYRREAGSAPPTFAPDRCPHFQMHPIWRHYYCRQNVVAVTPRIYNIFFVK